MEFLIWLGVIVASILVNFIPMIVLVLIFWSILDYGFLGGVFLAILTVVAIAIDVPKIRIRF